MPLKDLKKRNEYMKQYMRQYGQSEKGKIRIRGRNKEWEKN